MSYNLNLDKNKELITNETVKQNLMCNCYICKLGRTGRCTWGDRYDERMKEMAEGKHPNCGCTDFLLDENSPEALEYIVAFLESEYQEGESTFDTNTYPTAGAIWGAMNYCIKLYKEQNNTDEKVHNILNEIDEISRRVSAGKVPDNE